MLFDYLLEPVKQTDTNHDCDETNPFQPGEFIMEVKYSNLNMHYVRSVYK